MAECSIQFKFTLECREGVLVVCAKPPPEAECDEPEYCGPASINSMDPVDIEASITFQCGECAETTINVHIFECPDEEEEEEEELEPDPDLESMLAFEELVQMRFHDRRTQ